MLWAMLIIKVLNAALIMGNILHFYVMLYLLKPCYPDVIQFTQKFCYKFKINKRASFMWQFPYLSSNIFHAFNCMSNVHF